MIYTEETIVKLGRFKQLRIKDIPADYLVRIWENNKGGADLNLRSYLEANIDAIKERIGKPTPIPPIVEFKCQKKTFVNKREAQDALKEIRKDTSKGKKPLRSYECPKCSGWHLTSKTVDNYKKTKAMRSGGHKK